MAVDGGDQPGDYGEDRSYRPSSSEYDVGGGEGEGGEEGEEDDEEEEGVDEEDVAAAAQQDKSDTQ
jgi:hypothetical protein